MQLLALLRRCICIAIISAPTVLSSSFFLERDLFDVAPDDSLFSNELSLEDISSWNQDFGLDSNALLADSGPDPITETDSNFLSADSDVACAADDVENTNLFGKFRRENVCRDPQLGQSRGPDDPTPNPFDAYKNLITITNPLAPFPPDSQTCSPRLFESSKIPVCKDEFPPEDIVPVLLTRAFTLYNIDPSTAKSISPCRHSQPRLIESAKFNPPLFNHFVVRVSHYGVAKVFCGRYVFPQICPTSHARVLTNRIILIAKIKLSLPSRRRPFRRFIISG